MFKKKELKKRPFIIAEVGQNHQGSLTNALKYVKTFSEAGADAIKFQTRNNRYLFDINSYNAMYNSENAFAKTYGKHREHLELSLKELFLIKKECKKFNVKFICTPFDEYSLKNIIKLDVDAIKIASFDSNNISFIRKDAFLNCRSLEYLSIANNSLTRIAENNFHFLFSLIYLNLSRNEIDFIENNSFKN